VLAYELNMAALQASGKHCSEVLPEVAPPAAIEGFHQHLGQAMVDIGFSDPSNRKSCCCVCGACLPAPGRIWTS